MLYGNLAVRLGLEPMVYATGKGLEPPLPRSAEVHELPVLLEAPWDCIVSVWVEPQHDHWPGTETVEDAHEPLVITGRVVSLVLVLVELYDDRMRAHIEHKVGPVQMALDPPVVHDGFVGVPSLEVFLQLRLTGLEHTRPVGKQVRCASSAIFLGMKPT